jgi:hypothetical protein
MFTLLIEALLSQLPALLILPLFDPFILNSMILQLSLRHRLVKVAYLLQLPLLLLQLWQLHLLLILLFIYFIQWFRPFHLWHYTFHLFLLKHDPLLFLFALVDLVLNHPPLLVFFSLKFLVYQFLTLLHLLLQFEVTQLILVSLFGLTFFTFILETLDKGLRVFTLII